MNYLVQLKLADHPTTPPEGVAFIEQSILPTFELCKQLEAEKKIIAGGPLRGAIAFSLIVNGESVQELGNLMQAVRTRLEQLKIQGGAR